MYDDLIPACCPFSLLAMVDDVDLVERTSCPVSYYIGIVYYRVVSYMSYQTRLASDIRHKYAKTIVE